MTSLLNLDFYMLRNIFSYCSAMELCDLLCVSKMISLDGISLNTVSVHGFYVHEFALWLRKHRVLSISSLKIEKYYWLNDHCMSAGDNFYHCDCKEVILETLQSIHIDTLTLVRVDFDYQSMKWKSLRNLYVVDCRFKTDWINLQDSLKRLVVNSYSENYYYPEPLLSEQIVLYGLKLPELEYFESNGFIFEEQLQDFLDESVPSDALKTFRIQSLLDSENDYRSTVQTVSHKFKNAKVEVYV